MRMKRISLADMERPPLKPDTSPRRIPVYSSDLIAELDAAVPPRCIGPNESLEAAHRYAGQRQLIEHLLHRLQTTVSSDPSEPLINVPK